MRRRGLDLSLDCTPDCTLEPAISEGKANVPSENPPHVNPSCVAMLALPRIEGCIWGGGR